MSQTEFPGDDSCLEPPDPFPNSEVKQMRADDSVGLPHVKVGHRQGFILLDNSSTSNYDAGVAQLVEQLTCNQ